MEVNVEKITPYIEHPISIKITTEKEVAEAPMMHLTPKERKKLRRLKRQERTQEIILGIFVFWVFRYRFKMGILLSLGGNHHPYLELPYVPTE